MADLLTEQQVLNAVYDPTTGVLKVNMAGLSLEGANVNVDDVTINNIAENPVPTEDKHTEAIKGSLASVIGDGKTLPVSGTVSETNSTNIKAAAEAVQAAVEPGTIIAEGIKTVAVATTPEKLVASSTPCRRVWVGAPVLDDGTAMNTKVVRVSKNGTAGDGKPVLPDDHKGYYIPIDNAYDLTVRVGVNGERIAFIVYGTAGGS